MFDQQTKTSQPLAPQQQTLFDATVLEQLKGEQQRWEETTLQTSLGRMPERDHLMTTSGVPLHRLYTPLDRASFDYARDIGFPGQYPFTRAVQPTLYRAKPWILTSYHNFLVNRKSSR